MSPLRRLPISARHAFALAFDLAVRRDPLHSLVVPFLVRAPWIIAPAVVAIAWPTLRSDLSLLVKAAGVLLDFLAFVTLSAMFRFRAESVYKSDHDAPPGPVGEAYAKGVRRVPALYVTEALRNLAFTLTLPLVFPFLWVAFKFSLATEAVVLRQIDPIKASARSFHLTESRFERWLEMIVITVLLVVPFWFLMALGYRTVPGSPIDLWYALGMLLTAALMPLVQYAWTFFYLRLEESDALAVEVGSLPHQGAAGVEGAGGWQGATARQPRLKLVELRREDPDHDG